MKRGRPVKRDRIRWRHPVTQAWEHGEWWDIKARAVDGTRCPKCEGTQRGVVADDGTERGLLASCLNCGSERVVIVWDAWAQGVPTILLDIGAG